MSEDIGDHQLAPTGKLIVFEGISGCGKSTQMQLIGERLKNIGHDVVTTSWNSDVYIHPTIAKAKIQRRFTPLTWSILHAAEFSHRYFEIILPSLKKGKWVLADRYVVTAYVRDALRGIELGYIKNLYHYAVPPDIAFYFDISPQSSLERRKTRDPNLTYYVSGADIFRENDLRICFLKYQEAMRNSYLDLAKDFNFEIVDASKSKTEIFAEVYSRLGSLLKEI